MPPDVMSYLPSRPPTERCDLVVSRIGLHVAALLRADAGDAMVSDHIEICSHCAELFVETVELETGADVDELSRGALSRPLPAGSVAVWLLYLHACNLRDDDRGALRALEVLRLLRVSEGDEVEAKQLAELAEKVAASIADEGRRAPSPPRRGRPPQTMTWLATAASLALAMLAAYQQARLGDQTGRLADVTSERDLSRERVEALESELVALGRGGQPGPNATGRTGGPPPLGGPPATAASERIVAVPLTARTLGATTPQSPVIVSVPLPSLTLEFELPDSVSDVKHNVTLTGAGTPIPRQVSIQRRRDRAFATISLTKEELRALVSTTVDVTIDEPGHARVASYVITFVPE
jgi:hypothetical protein